ncbi:MAG: hypothetical protein RLZZ342_709 [Candidatus Parcubacteria bacterium]
MYRIRERANRLILIAGGALALCVLVPIGVRMTVSQHLYTNPNDLPSAQAVLVLGASVIAGVPSPILAERADAAIAIYTAERAKRILVSGDNGERSYDEVSAMLNYLVKNNVSPRDIFVDHAGFDTYSSVYRARYIFGARSLIIVTQDFHLPRAVFLARSMGIDASGVVAGNGGTASDYIREIPATIKALFDVATGRQPKYLGAPIPLVGKGNAARLYEAEPSIAGIR